MRTLIYRNEGDPILEMEVHESPTGARGIFIYDWTIEGKQRFGAFYPSIPFEPGKCQQQEDYERNLAFLIQLGGFKFIGEK